MEGGEEQGGGDQAEPGLQRASEQGVLTQPRDQRESHDPYRVVEWSKQMLDVSVHLPRHLGCPRVAEPIHRRDECEENPRRCKGKHYMPPSRDDKPKPGCRFRDVAAYEEPNACGGDDEEGEILSNQIADPRRRRLGHRRAQERESCQLHTEQEDTQDQRESMDGVVRINRHDSREALADGFGRKHCGHNRGGHHADVHGNAIGTDDRARKDTGSAQVKCAEEKRDSRREPREQGDRVVRPGATDRHIGEDDGRQRNQPDGQGRYRVEDQVPAQPSPGFSGMSSRGRISSIGKGSRMVVFFSEPISTIVWRKRSWSAPFCDEITAAALASVCEAWNSPSALMILARFSRSASACLAIARCIVVGSSTSLISTTATLMPQGSVCSSMIFCKFWLIFSRFASSSSRVACPKAALKVVCAIAPRPTSP